MPPCTGAQTWHHAWFGGVVMLNETLVGLLLRRELYSNNWRDYRQLTFSPGNPPVSYVRITPELTETLSYLTHYQ